MDVCAIGGLYYFFLQKTAIFRLNALLYPAFLRKYAAYLSNSRNFVLKVVARPSA